MRERRILKGIESNIMNGLGFTVLDRRILKGIERET